MGLPRFTREVVTADGNIKMSVKILPDNRTAVVLSDDSINFAATLDPFAANQLGKFLLHASSIAAMNLLDPTPQHIHTHTNDHDGVHMRSDR